MAGKRGATSELNHDNWNQEEEPEEQGTFRKASEDVLKTRAIKTARRRNPIRSETENRPGVFTSFTGFGSKSAVSTDFSFLKDLSKPETTTTKTNGIDASSKPTMPDFNKTDTSKNTGSIFGGGTGAPPVPKIFGAGNVASTISNCQLVPGSATGNKKSENYCARLKGLNESVSKWIVKKVEENPLISLQPIFKDYERYLTDIEKEESATGSGEMFASKGDNVGSSVSFNFNLLSDKNTVAAPSVATEKTEETQPAFKFGTSTTASGINSNIPTFSFGAKANNSGPTKSFSDLTSVSGTTKTPSFSFGSNVSNSGTSLTSTIPLIPSSSAVEKPTENKQEKDNDDEEPPKPDFTPVVEKDHIYTIKCKVFVKKEDNFGDRGVGNLYLKPVENSEKVQLIVRADTNLGNLLLNFILSKSVPTKRMGKRDVMLVALPMPDAKPPPTPILVRVKSSEEADKLLEVLDKHKK